LPPRVIVNTLDGGLTAAFAPKDDSILVIGTAGQGVVNTPYQVTDRAVAAKEFGFSGSLERAIEECASNSDNILAFRAGTKPMVLAGVGLDTTTGAATAGFDITFNDVTADAGTRYQIWYSAGILNVWKDGTLQYSNVANAAVDTADISLSATATGNAGLELGTGATPTLATSVTVTRCLPLAAHKKSRAPAGRASPDPPDRDGPPQVEMS